MATIPNLFATDYSSTLFEPDPVVATQFYATFKVSPYKQPELRLMAAVLEDAIGCVSIDLRSATARQLKQFEQASQWFAAEDESEWTFSFENICEALGIHPGYLRSLIQSSAAGKQNRAAPRANRARSSRRHTPITLGTGS